MGLLIIMEPSMPIIAIQALPPSPPEASITAFQPHCMHNSPPPSHLHHPCHPKALGLCSSSCRATRSRPVKALVSSFLQISASTIPSSSGEVLTSTGSRQRSSLASLALRILMLRFDVMSPLSLRVGIPSSQLSVIRHLRM